MRGVRSPLRPVVRSAFGGSDATATPFVGVLDLLSTQPVAAWSVARRLTRTYDGPLVRLRRASDDAEKDFGCDGEGNLESAELETWAEGSLLRVAKIFDQTGTDAQEAPTPMTAPALDLSSFGGRPSASFTGTEVLVATGASAQAFSGEDNYRTLAGVTRIRTGAAYALFGGAWKADGQPVLMPIGDPANTSTQIWYAVGGYFGGSQYQTYSATPMSVVFFSTYGEDAVRIWWGQNEEVHEARAAGHLACTSVTIGGGWRTDTSEITRGGRCWWSEMILFQSVLDTDRLNYVENTSIYYGVE